MKTLKKTILIILTLMLVCSFSVITNAETSYVESDYIPLWMKPYSVIVYDADGKPAIVEGGKLSAEDIAGRKDIAAVGFTDTSDEMLVTPNTKVEYDLHGFIQNIYYLVPGTTSQYQLSNPMASRVNSGIMDRGTYTYPITYYNYDTGKDQACELTRTAGSPYDKMTGTGRITFFTGEYGEADTRLLRAGDCATKEKYDDVKGGTKIMVTNLNNGKSESYEKWDVGSMPKAILDIWSDETTNPITWISNGGKIDNVYSGYIVHKVIPY